jgi:hypothetical protein
MNNNDTSIISFIKQTKWESFEKLYPIVKEKYPSITSKHLIDNNITLDIKTPIKYNSKFNNKIVINHRYSYQMDIFVNNSSSNAKNNTNISSTIYLYYLIRININTRYIELYHLGDRSATSVLNALKYIFNILTIKSLESDEEKSFVSSEILDYL